jgi:hypothetical protein
LVPVSSKPGDRKIAGLRRFCTPTNAAPRRPEGRADRRRDCPDGKRVASKQDGARSEANGVLRCIALVDECLVPVDDVLHEGDAGRVGVPFGGSTAHVTTRSG